MISTFFDAVAEGDSELVDELIERKVPVNSLDDDGNTPLLLAAEGEPQIVEALLKAGADVNHQNNSGLTALMRAVAYEDEDIIGQLLTAGASMDLVDEMGKNAGDYATNDDVRAALGLSPLATMRRGGRDSTPVGKRASVSRGDGSGRRASVANVSVDVAGLFDAVSCGDVDYLIECLNSGTPIDSRDDDNNTPLIIAAEGESGILQELLDRGANIDLQNRNGVTALIAAVKYEDPEIVGMLIDAGADLTLKDRKGRSAADFAEETDMAVQRQMKALFGVKDESGKQKRGKNRRRRKSMVYVDQQTRQLLEAVTDGNLPMVRELLRDGCAVNSHDDDGNTALIFAAESEPLIVQVLLQHGANPDQQNRSGGTALMTAIRAEDRDCIRALVDSNASTSIQNRDGQTPIDLARQTGNEEILRLVLGLSEGLVVKTKSTPKLPMEVMRRGSLPSTSSVDRRTRAFLEAVSEGDAERVDRILQMDFDVNCADDTGFSPLHFAAEGEPRLMRILINHGSNVNAQNHMGETPLMTAIRFGDAACVEILLDNGASCFSMDAKQRSVMDYADMCNSSIIQNVVREASRR